MYARYVPPAKAKPATQSSPPPPPAQPSPAAPNGTPYARYTPSGRKPAPAPAPAAPHGAERDRLRLAQRAPTKVTFNYDEDEESAILSKKPSYPEDSRDGDEESQRSRKRAKISAEAADQPEEEKKVKKKDRKKGKDAEDPAPEPQPPTEDVEMVDEDGATPKRSKKDKKEKKSKKDRKKEEVIEDSPAPPIVESKTEAMVIDEEESATPKRSKDKKEKKSKESKSKTKHEAPDGDVEMTDIPIPEAAEEEEREGEENSRHKSVLKKKEKSIQNALASQAKAEKRAESSKPIETLEDLLPPPETDEVHALGPLPQPAPAILDTSAPSYETLPPWLAKPVLVSSDERAAWSDLGMRPELGVSPEAAKVLAVKGFAQAFAVQTAVIPRLLPNSEQWARDLVISAATGSGKTLAYVLPIIRDISLGMVTKLRALIVVPTRELVRQVLEVCEACAVAFSGPGRKRVRIGTAVGNQAFAKEQTSLMEEELRYDPEGYAKLVEERKWESMRRRELEDADFDMLELLDTELPLVQHVVDRNSKVDVLICTPGRLVEHIERTPGFTLDYVRWLVIDEADKLLEQSFQQWLDIVMERLSTDKRPGIRDFPMQPKSGVRKVVLSATMTRNISILNKLQLRRPEMIILEGKTASGDLQQSESLELSLPEQLQESAIKVRDPEHKPLYLIDLLNSSHIRTSPPVKVAPKSTDDASDTSSSESESDSDSDTSSSGSDSDSDTSSDSDSDTEEGDNAAPSKPSAKKPTTPSSTGTDTVLVFTRSNETALRLSRLLGILSPKHLAPVTGTLVSEMRTSERKKVLRAFEAGKLRVLVASDLVARGLDLKKLDHVVNYDMPPSVRAYVHRVGRTARAGREGHAWTFFTKNEAGWFFAEIAGGKGESKGDDGGSGVSIRRAGKVETVRVTERRSKEEREGSGSKGDFGEDRLAEYETALATLGQETKESRAR